MTDPATLNALASEVEAGTGPDRDLDARVWEATHLDDWLVLFGTVGAHDYVVNSIEGGTLALPPFTDSVDAALGLLAGVLPNWRVKILATCSAGCSADAEQWDEGGRLLQVSSGSAPDLPRAIVAAVLRGVAARGEG